MQWRSLLAALQLAVTATLVSGLPAQDSSLEARDYHVKRDGDEETHIFRRDAPITARDLELGELNGINLTRSMSSYSLSRAPY